MRSIRMTGAPVKEISSNGIQENTGIRLILLVMKAWQNMSYLIS